MQNCIIPLIFEIINFEKEVVKYFEKNIMYYINYNYINFINLEIFIKSNYQENVYKFKINLKKHMELILMTFIKMNFC